jgi:hypothetical protein
VSSADDAKDDGTIIYAVGYDLDALDGGANECKEEDPSGPDERPAITAYEAIRAIASDSDKFYEKPSPGDLRGIFGRIATDMMEGAAGLVDNATR